MKIRATPCRKEQDFPTADSDEWGSGLEARLGEVVVSLALEALRLRESCEDPGQCHVFSQEQLVQEAAPQLTTRQQEVLELLRRGWSYQQVAKKLKISPRTVAKHASGIYAFLNVENRYAAVSLLSVQEGVAGA